MEEILHNWGYIDLSSNLFLAYLQDQKLNVVVVIYHFVDV